MPVFVLATPPPSSIPNHIIHTSPQLKIPDNKVEELNRSKNPIPVVPLNLDSISDAVAARLATSLIGHVLFLKSQIPLPVVQLARMQSTKSSARALKQKTEFISSFDTLASHLNTTFTALSSAFAKVTAHKGSEGGKRARAYLAILVGPSVITAKSKTIYAVDGLEVKAIGERDDDLTANQIGQKLEEENGSKKSDNDEETRECDNSGQEDETEGDGSDDGDSEEDVGTTDDETDDESVSSPPPSPSPSPETPSIPSYAEQQRALQAAERLLSRTLAAADAEGIGILTDMAPTQTHILLRAPRRFVHPAWIPRQSITSPMENILKEFLLMSDIELISDSKPQKVHKKGRAIEGVWVASRDKIDSEAKSSEFVPSDGAEWDEMIWWIWDGKITGFTEW